MAETSEEEKPYTVADLIAELQKLPADMRVMTRGYEGGFHDASAPTIQPIKLNKNSGSFYGPHDHPDKYEAPDLTAAIL